MSTTAPLVLASGSPRRRRALGELGVAFDVVPAADDGPARDADPARRVLAHARHKAATVAAQRPDAWVLAADTLVVRDGRFLGKPADAAAARAMLEELSGREHEVWTGSVLLGPGGRPFAECAERAVVRFRRLGADEIAAYLAGDEWRDKAGAYGIQGWAGERAEVTAGDFAVVVGAPTDTWRGFLAAAGLLAPSGDAC